MKKVLSFVLVLSMILGSFGMAFAAPAADVVGKECEDAVNVLTELGVIAGYEDGSFKPEKVVTRAEMATFIVKAMGLADYAVEKSAFTDMAGHWADPFVAYAASLGFVAGNTDGTFAPDKTVSYDQAITMVVQALGYKGEFLVGGYPGAFVNQAKALDILSGIKSGVAGANRGDIAQLLFNALDEEFVRYTKDGACEGTKDYMIVRLGALADPGAFVVEGTEPSDINLAEYVGAYVKVYKDGDTKDIIAVSDVKSEFITGKFTTDAAVSVGALTSGSIEFKVDDVTYTIEDDAISTGAFAFRTFINGEKDATLDEVSSAASFTLAVKLSGKKIVDLYSVSAWDYEGNHDQASADVQEEITEDQKLLAKKFELDNNDEIDMSKFELLGVKSLADIEEDDVVYVYEGAQYIRRVAVGQEVVTGKISKINADEDKITVNGKVYETYNGDDFVDVVAGDEVELTLDYYGDVYAYEVVKADADLMGIVVDTAAHVAGLNGSVGKIQLFTEEGKVVTFEIDNDDLTGGAFNTLIGAEVTAGAVVEYNVDKAGKMNTLTAPAVATKAGVDVTAKGYVAGMKLAEDAKIFTADTVVTATGIVAADADFEDALAVGSYKALLDKENVDVIYHYKATTGKIDWIVVSGGTASEGVYAVYNGYSAVDNAGDDDFEIELMIDGKDAKYTSEAQGSNLAMAGDVLYEVVLDASGVLTELDAVTDGESNADGRITVTTEAIASVSAVKNNVVTVTYGAVEVRYALDEEVLVYAWDAEDEVWTKGTVSDIKDADFRTVQFYDVVGADLAYDIVMVK